MTDSAAKLYADKLSKKQARNATCLMTCKCGGAYGLDSNKYSQQIPPWGIGCTRCGRLHKNSLACWRKMNGTLKGDDLMQYGLHLIVWYQKNKK